MKKRIITVIAVMLSAVCVFCVVSCENEDTMCTCTETGSGYSATQQVDPSSFGAKNCADLAVKLRMASSDFDYNCY